MNKILVLGDIHFPYHNKKALKEAMYAVRSEKPDCVVQIGDLYDQYSFSRFTRKNITLPEYELQQANNYAKDLWSAVKRSGAKAFQILGNHDMRLIKRAEEKLPEAQELIKESLMELYRFKGVTTIEDDRKELVISGVTFHHGFRSKLGDHSKYNGVPTVVGHSHVGGVVFQQLAGGIIWELNAGYLADETAEPLRYRPQNTSRWTLGYGLITKGRNGYQPQFIPIEV